MKTVVDIVLFVVAASVGTVGRAAIAARLNRPLFAWGTLTVNVVGSLALGLLHGAPSWFETIGGVGFLGSFTTFSSFSRDAIALVERDKLLRSAIYLAVTIFLCLTAAELGITLAP